MTSFWDVLLSPVAVNKFTHTVTSSFVLAALFVVVAVCAWYLLRGREQKMARKSIAVASVFGLVFVADYRDSRATARPSDRGPGATDETRGSSKPFTTEKQGAALTAVGVLEARQDRTLEQRRMPSYFKIAIPKMLSLMSFPRRRTPSYRASTTW